MQLATGWDATAAPPPHATSRTMSPPLSPPVAPPLSPGIRRALDFIEENYAEPVPLSVLAGLSGLSLHRFVTVFRHQVGLPPHRYVCRVRVREAQALLRRGRPLAEVALDTGFFDQSHLSRHFKRHCGMTPGSFAGGRNTGSTAPCA